MGLKRMKKWERGMWTANRIRKFKTNVKGGKRRNRQRRKRRMGSRRAKKDGD
jgi:hypothetical protein